VERRHERPTGGALDEHGLGVHADVEQARGQAEGEQRRHQGGQAGCQAERNRQQGHADPRDHHGQSAPGPVHDPAGKYHHDHESRGTGEQRDAQHAVGQMQALLDRRDPG